MKKRILFLGWAFSLHAGMAHAQVKAPAKDWLIDHKPYVATVMEKDKTITLSNGLLSRSFRITPNVVCTDYRNLVNGDQLLRAVKPEARITVNGHDYMIGGAYGQPQQAYLLPAWLDKLTAGDKDFKYTGHQVTNIQPYLKWKAGGWSSNPHQPTGKALVFSYQSAVPELKGIEVKVHYEIFDGIPLLAKWLEITNGSGQPVKLHQVVNEILATPEEESAVVGSVTKMQVPHNIYVESNYAFNNAMKANLSDQTTHWKADSTYTSQVNYDYQTPCLLEVYPTVPVGISMAVFG